MLKVWQGVHAKLQATIGEVGRSEGGCHRHLSASVLQGGERAQEHCKADAVDNDCEPQPLLLPEGLCREGYRELKWQVGGPYLSCWSSLRTGPGPFSIWIDKA